LAALHKYELSFFTATILEWKHLLINDTYKDIITGSLKFLVADKRINVNAFVIMSNHMHLLWHIKHPHTTEAVQRDFLRYTAQMMLKDLRNDHPELQEQFRVNAKDRKYQVWERNALSVPIWTEKVLLQKLHYIHNNPVKAGLCTHPCDYKYSSAAFYEGAVDDFGFLSHYRYG
jgi:REP element-mobilizing transposase RayT